MTTRPRLHRGNKVVGVAAAALFVVLATVFLSADFADAATFQGATDITTRIGYAMFNLALPEGPVGSEGFLVAFEIIDLVLAAALVAAVMLAFRDEDREGVLPITDGGESAAAPDDEGGGGD